jgi:uncharacterized protein (DUF924 family)
LADDLGLEPAEVHVKAREVLGFWFDLVMPEQRFAKSASLDSEIRTLFGDLRDRVKASGAAQWRGDPEALLAAVILLDQFSRNLHRGEAEAFAADPLAQELTLLALDKSWEAGIDAERRAFLYMPLMHAEDQALQKLSVARFAEPGLEQNLDYARDHADCIARFGRFPSRNEALGRQSTPGELDYLSQPGAGW